MTVVEIVLIGREDVDLCTRLLSWIDGLLGRRCHSEQPDHCDRELNLHLAIISTASMPLSRTDRRAVEPQERSGTRDRVADGIDRRCPQWRPLARHVRRALA